MGKMDDNLVINNMFIDIISTLEDKINQ